MLCGISPGDGETQVPLPGARSPGFDPTSGDFSWWSVALEDFGPPWAPMTQSVLGGAGCATPWVGDKKFLALSNKLSTLQIIANHHMQSISFASGGDPVSMQGM